jgi:hypothetical protein
MITTSIRVYKKILRNFKSGKILNKLGSGKRVFFENPLEEIAFKYIPGEIGKLSKYYIKHPGQDEHEIDSDSSSILTAVMEGKPISKARYDNYHFIEGISWNFGIYKTPATNKAVGN